MQSGKAPVCVHEIYNAVATCPAGIRPVPVAVGAAEMRAALVRVVAHDNGTATVLDATGWTLVPHMAANRDAESGPLADEQDAALVIHVRVPPGYVLVRASEYTRNPESPAPVATDDDTPPDDAPRVIPELAAVDQDVFETRPDAVNRAMREIFAKGRTNQGSQS